MQHSNIQKRHFTLVELMVAMGVLVIMMGFLFQFTIGAQRIWNASSKQTTAFSSAQVLMDVLNDDLMNMRYSNEEGETRPFYLHKDGNDVFMAFYAEFTPSTGILASKKESQVGTYPVIYFFDNENQKIHRCALDRDTYILSNGSKKELKNPNPTPEQCLWRLCGADFSSDVDYFTQLKNFILTSTESLKLFDVLADNLQNFEVKVFSNDSDFNPASGTIANHYVKVKPIAIKVQFELESDINAKGEGTKYSFHKVLFL